MKEACNPYKWGIQEMGRKFWTKHELVIFAVNADLIFSKKMNCFFERSLIDIRVTI